MLRDQARRALIDPERTLLLHDEQLRSDAPGTKLNLLATRAAGRSRSYIWQPSDYQPLQEELASV
jgi:hypothetical protein